MYPSRPLALAVIFAGAVAACSSSSNSGSSATPDAGAAVDGSTSGDGGASSVKALGQPCVVAMSGADCPTTEYGCLSFGATATMGICSLKCVSAGAITTDAQGEIPLTAAQEATCTGAFAGTVGTAACAVVLSTVPAENPLIANKMYTVDIACGIVCGTGNTCPSGLTCSTADGLCEP
jgi:hypothetical protein